MLRTCLPAAWIVAALAGFALAEPARPPVLQRQPFNGSRVIGSPDPPPPYRVRRVLPELQVASPIGIVHEPGTASLLVIHQTFPWVGPGRILRVRDDGKGSQVEVLLDIDYTIYGVAFHPDYPRNGYLYIGCNGPVSRDDRDIPGRRFRPEAPKMNRIVRYTVSRQAPFTLDPQSETLILDWPSNGHNGADLAFGPDGMLYITSGDGTSDSDTDLAGQDLSRLLAKVLRIDVDRPDPGKAYGIPRDNPFLKTPGARPETWAYGFRNPWRLFIDRKRGDVWVGNNGQDLWEQIYLVQRGANYGWSVVEGSHPFYPTRKAGPTPFSKPIAEHHHSEARSLTGGRVYEGAALPELKGAYIYGDWSTGKIWGLRHDRGKVTWHQELADSPLQISGFGASSSGELLIVDYAGGIYELERAPQEAAAPAFPTRLSETGLFASVAEHRVAPGLIPYSVNAPLWSDGADKERFMAIPGLEPIEFTAERGWTFPDGTVLVKTFTLGGRRIETRLLTRQQGEWAGYSYRWNAEQSDAELVRKEGLDEEYPVAGRKQSWHFPSRAECMVCHSRAANFVLGPSLLQMNRDHDYAGGRANQLEALEQAGVFRVSGLELFRELKHRAAPFRDSFAGLIQLLKLENPLAPTRARFDSLIAAVEEELRQRPWYVNFLPRRPADYPRLVDPYDARADLDRRARSYLHANCAQCHVTAGGGNALIDLEFGTPLDRMKLLGVSPHHILADAPDAGLLTPGQPDRSTLLLRLARRGTGQMPPLATAQVDQQAVVLLREWIRKMPRRSGR